MMGRGLSKAGVDKDPVIWHSSLDPKFNRKLHIWKEFKYMQNFWNYLSADICRIKIGFWMDIDLGWKLLDLKQKLLVRANYP